MKGFFSGDIFVEKYLDWFDWLKILKLLFEFAILDSEEINSCYPTHEATYFELLGLFYQQHQLICPCIAGRK